MRFPGWGKRRDEPPAGEIRFEDQYAHFRRILNWNTECLERIAELQANLRFVSPRAGNLDESIQALFERAGQVVEELDALAGRRHLRLAEGLGRFQAEVESYLGELRASPPGRLAASLDELDSSAEPEAGGKAAVLGEVRRRLHLPVPDAFVVTTEAYRRFCEQPNWVLIRDKFRWLEHAQGRDVAAASQQLTSVVREAAVPDAIRTAIEARSSVLGAKDFLAVRSSACGEAGAHAHAGQFLSLLHVPPTEAVDAYREVVASRFSERALSYRLAIGMAEVDCPVAVLFMRMVPARAAGILYTCNPTGQRHNEMWIHATSGLGIDLAAGGEPADFVAVSRKSPHSVMRVSIASKESCLRPQAGGGVVRVALPDEDRSRLSIGEDHLRQLAQWALAIENHFGAPQDIEWALGEDGQLWILQARKLTMVDSASGGRLARPRGEPVLEGGTTVCPGRVSGEAWLVDSGHTLGDAPAGCVIFLRKASPEVAQVLSRAEGLVAEWGNLGGHAAALLREFRVPSVFLLEGAFEALKHGEPVSLDASQGKLYRGSFWPGRPRPGGGWFGTDIRLADPIHERILNLNLLSPSGAGFRERSCASLHDVLRYCHEKAVEVMFGCHDTVSRTRTSSCRQLKSNLPLNMLVLDIGDGVSQLAPDGGSVTPSQITSRPFQAIWKGFVHPGVSWTRDMPVSFSDITSVLAGSLSTSGYMSRALGERSYLMVARDYFNLNARLAYHFTLIDACLTDTPSANYALFRFAGGGAARGRRNLRACFIEACLNDIGFRVDRRGDLVNAWLKNIEPDVLTDRLDVLGRLTASACQLDMYMDSLETVSWFVRQFREGNYKFELPEEWK